MSDELDVFERPWWREVSIVGWLAAGVWIAGLVDALVSDSSAGWIILFLGGSIVCLVLIRYEAATERLDKMLDVERGDDA